MKQVVTCLRENAVIIEALATVILAVITGIYVRLTYAHLKHTKEADRLNRQQYAQTLEFFALRLREAIGNLGDVPIHKKLTASFFLTESDITELRVLAK